MSSIKIDRKLIFNRKGQIVQRLRNNSGGSVSAGAVVIYDSTTTDAFTTTTSQDDEKVAGICLATVGNQETAEVLWWGFTDLLKVDGTTDIAAGDFLSTFTTAGIAAKRSAVTKPGVFAMALEAYATDDGNGVIDAWVFPATHQDSSGVSGGTVGLVGEMAADGLGSANALGATTTKYAPISHVHTNTADTPALTLGTTNAVGTAGLILASDATIALFDTTVPTTIAINATAAVGSAAFAARRDHTHGFPNSAAPADGSSMATANADGSASTLSRSDHAHKAIILNDGNLIFGTTDGAASAVRIEYDTGETTDALKIGVNTASRRIIICDYADMTTDTTLALAADPELVIYDNTLADYIRFRATTAGGFIDVPSGDTIALQVAAATEVTIDANGITLAAANYIQNNGAAGALRKMLTDVNGNELLETYGTASAVNHLTLTNSATGTGVILGANGTGADANADMTLLMNGTGALIIDNGTDPVAIKLLGAQGGVNSIIYDVNGNELLGFNGTASAVTYLAIINNTAGAGNVQLEAASSEATCDLILMAKSTGKVVIDNGTDPVGLRFQGAAGGYNNNLLDVNSNEILELQGVASAVNQLAIKNAIATANPTLEATGGDANISITLTPKAAGQLNVAPGTAGTAAAPDLIIGGDIDTGLFGGTNILAVATAGAEVARFSAVANLHLGGTAVGATQAGTKVLYFYNAGTNPSGTIASGAALYCSAGEIYTLDSGGVATLQSPHAWEYLEGAMGMTKSDPLAWAFHAIHNVEGEEIGVDMLAVVKAVEALAGKKLIYTRRLAS